MHDVDKNHLMHWKYVSREFKNGRWHYKYRDQNTGDISMRTFEKEEHAEIDKSMEAINDVLENDPRIIKAKAFLEKLDYLLHTPIVDLIGDLKKEE